MVLSHRGLGWIVLIGAVSCGGDATKAELSGDSSADTPAQESSAANDVEAGEEGALEANGSDADATADADPPAGVSTSELPSAGGSETVAAPSNDDEPDGGDGVANGPPSSATSAELPPDAAPPTDEQTDTGVETATNPMPTETLPPEAIPEVPPSEPAPDPPAEVPGCPADPPGEGEPCTTRCTYYDCDGEGIIDAGCVSGVVARVTRACEDFVCVANNSNQFNQIDCPAGTVCRADTWESGDGGGAEPSCAEPCDGAQQECVAPCVFTQQDVWLCAAGGCEDGCAFIITPQ